MPFIHVRASPPIPATTEQEIVRQLGETMPLIGKSERWLMTRCEENCHLYFQGNCDAGTAFVSVALFGAADQECYDAMTEAITHIVATHLSIAPDRIYIQYQEASTWGWNGSNF